MASDEHHSARAKLDTLKVELLAEKDAAKEGTEPIVLDQACVGRLSRMDSMQQQAMAQELDRRRDIQLKRIEGAYQRLDKGTYGLCSTCQTPIEEARINFDPTVFFCQACATKAERR